MKAKALIEIEVELENELFNEEKVYNVVLVSERERKPLLLQKNKCG